MGVTLNVHLIMHSMLQERETVWMVSYLRLCSLGVAVVGLLLCSGGGWIIKDHLDTRHHLRIYYEEGIHGTQLKEAEEIRSYYSIHSDNQQWINYGCVSAVIGFINIMMSLVMFCTPPDDCLGCMILNYVITLTLGMSLSFMGLGFLFALLIAGLLGISYGIRQHRRNV